MNCLAPFCLLAIFMVHRAYALFAQDLSKVKEPNKTNTPFNPSNGEQLKRLQLLGAPKLLTKARPTNMLIAPLLGAPKLLMSGSVNNNIFELPKMRLCSCQDYECTCCVSVGAGMMKQEVCVFIMFNRNALSVHFKVDLNGSSLADFTIGASNLLDSCTPLTQAFPFFGCLRLYQAKFLDSRFHVCISLLLNQSLFEHKLNCLEFSQNGLRLTKDGRATKNGLDHQ